MVKVAVEVEVLLHSSASREGHRHSTRRTALIADVGWIWAVGPSHVATLVSGLGTTIVVEPFTQCSRVATSVTLYRFGGSLLGDLRLGRVLDGECR